MHHSLLGVAERKPLSVVSPFALLQAPPSVETATKKMEACNGKLAQGEESVAGSIFGENVHIGAGHSEFLSVKHVGDGNQGVFVTAVALRGRDANDFDVAGLSSEAPFLVAKGEPALFRVQNNGVKSNARA